MTDTPADSSDDGPPFDKESWRSTLEHAFVSSAYSVEQWFSCARALFAAAMASWNRADQLHHQTRQDRDALEAVAFMLAGMSLECLFKTIIVGELPEADLTTALPKWFKTHDLPFLAEKAGIVVSDEETFCLLNLGEYVTWAGRYPVPNSLEKMGRAMVPEWRNLYVGLYRRLARPFDITA